MSQNFLDYRIYQLFSLDPIIDFLGPPKLKVLAIPMAPIASRLSASFRIANSIYLSLTSSYPKE